MKALRSIAVRVSWRGLLLAFVFSVTATILMRYQSSGIPARLYEPGDIAREDIYSPRDITIEDDAATERRRREAADSVRSVYDYNPNEIARVVDRLQAAFTLGRSSMGETKPTREEQATLEQRFEDALGVQVSAEELRSLIANRFSRTMEQAIRDLLFASMRGQLIVSSKELLTADLNKGILRRTIDGSSVQQEEAMTDMRTVVDLNDVRTLLKTRSNDLLGQSVPFSRPHVLSLAQKMVRPTLTFNQAETERRRQESYQGDHNVVQILVRKGAIVIRAGSVVEPRHIAILKGLSQTRTKASDWWGLGGLTAISLLLVAILRLYMPALSRRDLQWRDALLMGGALLLLLFISRFTLFLAGGVVKAGSTIPGASYQFLLPICTAAMLTRVLIGAAPAALISVMSGIFASLLLDNTIFLGIFYFLSSIFAAQQVGVVRTRSDVLRAGLMTGGMNMVLALFLTAGITLTDPLSAGLDPSETFWNCLMAFSGGIYAALLLTVLLTLSELIFNYTTDFKLLELASQNSPLLRELMVQAPGTYHHSVIIGSLSEAAANAIGENGLLARVACLYHDIGKSKKPMYFVENQSQGENRHDRLTARMSARVIQAHVKDGIEMARAAKLPREIVDIIPQHHGTRLISFFFRKAREQADPEMETIDEKDFRYEGPKPQSRVAGIILLADGLEAITRTLEDPTPARIKGVVRDHINKIFAEGELDETDLTLRDLSAIGNAFIRVLTSIFHHRIDYPTQATDYPTGGPVDPAYRLRKVHDHQDSKSGSREPGRSEEGGASTSTDSPRLKIT